MQLSVAGDEGSEDEGEPAQQLHLWLFPRLWRGNILRQLHSEESRVSILSCLHSAKMSPVFTFNSFCVIEQHLFVLPFAQASDRIALPSIFCKESTCGFVADAGFWGED